MESSELQSLTLEEYRGLLKTDAQLAQERFIESPTAPEGERWRCRKCNTEAKAATIAHPIWDGPFDGAGSGKCDYRQIPYCQSCDGDRSSWESDLPIRIPFPLATGEPVSVMKRLVDRLVHFGLPPIFTKR